MMGSPLFFSFSSPSLNDDKVRGGGGGGGGGRLFVRMVYVTAKLAVLYCTELN